MKRGLSILIVAVVAIATNIGLHAAFGWGMHGHWKNHHRGPHGGCEHEGYDQERNGHSNNANPWHCGGENEPVKDTVVK